ncbi:MAG: DUF3575 domain-containing protein [Bacteroidetes bacterium]|nr:DUF3575 domain-containing protein [Bacteroidota bacterium]
MKRIIVLSIFILSFVNTFAQEKQRSAGVFFRQGVSEIELNYKDNKANLDDFFDFITVIKEDSSLVITKLELKASASPDGSRARNQQISKQRIASLKKYIKENLSVPDSLIVTTNKGIAWGKLRDMVDTSHIAYRKEILDIIDNVPDYVFKNGVIITGKKKELMDLKGGRPYNFLVKNFFSDLRSANLLELYYIDVKTLQLMTEAEVVVPTKEVMILEEPLTEDIEIEEVEEDIEIEDEMIVVENPQLSNKSPKKEFPLIALKTNLLYDLALTPNIGIEVPIGEKWSVAAEWAYAWWSNDSNHRYWRMYGGSLEVRRWFGGKSNRYLTGHHVGVYASAGTYDVEFSNKGYQSKFSYTIGASYGYSLPIAKALNLDFEIGVGYLAGEYKEYEPKNGDYLRIATKKRNYFGPTKGQVSLVWLIGNSKNKKGGVL